MSVHEPQPVLVGYRPRRVVRMGPDFPVHGVHAVASACSCIAKTLVPGDQPEWNLVNSAWHYASAREAAAAGARAGYAEAEVHATLLAPLLFEGKKVRPFRVAFTSGGGDAWSAEPVPATAEVLGWDVVSIDSPQSPWAEPGVLGGLDIGCAPLSCNMLGTDFPVNRWCLLERWQDAEAAARRFAHERPEPGPFVIVQVARVPRADTPGGVR